MEVTEKSRKNEYNRTPGFQKVFTDTKYGTAKSKSDKEKVVFKDILHKTNYNTYKPGKRRMSGRDRYIKNALDNEVRRILILGKQLKGRGVEKIVK